MAMSDISLTAGMRQNLVGLQGTMDLIDRTQTRLSTGKKVNSAVDDPINYFASRSHLLRAGDLAARKDGMAEAINTITAGMTGIEQITSLIDQAKGIANSALQTTDTASRASFATQFDTVMSQITSLAADSGYKGTNLLESATTTLSVKFNEDGSAKLDTVGFSATTVANLSLNFSGVSGNWATSASTGIDSALKNINTATEYLRSKAQNLAANLSIVTTRQDFTTGMINTLEKGADDLTLADMNQEGANMLMLQTRQSLGTTSLSIASQAAQSVLRLF